MAAGLGSLTGTLQGANVLTPEQAAVQDAQAQLGALLQAAAQNTSASTQAAQQAGQQYQQAAAAPPPDIPAMAAFIPTLFSNLASVIGQRPAYAENTQQDLAMQRSALLQARGQNLQALASNWNQKAEAAQKLGDIEAELQARTKIAQLTAAHEKVIEQQKADAARELEQQRQAGRMELERLRAQRPMRPAGGAVGGIGGLLSQTDPEAIAAGIASGEFPPDISQYSRYASGAIASVLRKKYNFDLLKSQSDYKAFQRHWATLNTGVQKRLQQSIQNAYGTTQVLDELNAKLSDLVPRYRQTPLNRLAQLAQSEGLGSDEAAATVTQLRALAATLRFELANVYMGGGVPTDQAQKRAGEIINPDVAPARLAAQIAIARRELGIRQNAINTAGTVSPSNPATVEAQPPTVVGPRQFPAPAERMVRMRAPDGTVKAVPYTKVEAYKARGAKVVP